MKQVSVRALAEFAAKTGDLERGFSPVPSAMEGIEGHQHVAASRDNGYQKELALEIKVNGLLIRGRADGYCATSHCLEEVKTFYGQFKQIKQNKQTLHWAQVKLYAWMFCEANQCEQISIALVYFHLTQLKEYRLEQQWQRADLATFASEIVTRYHSWIALQQLRIQKLTLWLEALNFPFQPMRPSQRKMAETLYKCVMTRTNALFDAPTGTGKTLASLFPSLKAMAYGDTDHVFYCTNKSTTKQLALDALRQVQDSNQPEIPLRVIELSALEKVCLSPESDCHGEQCLFAKGFYDKLQKVRNIATESPILDSHTLKNLALEHEICPYYLSMEMVRWVDVIVCDVNYLFDRQALLPYLINEYNWRASAVVDEAHGFPERAKSMFSAQLKKIELLSARKSAPKPLKKALGQILRHWPSSENNVPLTRLNTLTAKWLSALREFINRFISWQQKQEVVIRPSPTLQQFFFSAIQFLDVLDMIDQDYAINLEIDHLGLSNVCLRNQLPARLLQQVYPKLSSICFFSATLQPFSFFQQLLGLPDDTVQYQVDSPFFAKQLNVRVTPRLSTRYQDRQHAIGPISELILRQTSEQPGNAIAFFPSYEFMQQVVDTLSPQLTSLPIRLIQQKRSMSEPEAKAFLAQFEQHTNLLAFAVLGGSFAEGIDLPGSQLTGVFIATLGLPQINPLTRQYQQALQSAFNMGYEYAFLYPGLHKVIQAAGRVIRTQQDQGYVVLMDDRFMHSTTQQLFPHWWPTPVPI